MDSALSLSPLSIDGFPFSLSRLHNNGRSSPAMAQGGTRTVADNLEGPETSGSKPVSCKTAGGLDHGWPYEAARPSSTTAVHGFLARKGRASTVQSTRNTIPAVVSVGSPEKWSEHSGGTNHDFKRSFLSPWSSPGLKSDTYQLVSSRVSI